MQVFNKSVSHTGSWLLFPGCSGVRVQQKWIESHRATSTMRSRDLLWVPVASAEVHRVAFKGSALVLQQLLLHIGDSWVDLPNWCRPLCVHYSPPRDIVRTAAHPATHHAARRRVKQRLAKRAIAGASTRRNPLNQLPKFVGNCQIQLTFSEVPCSIKSQVVFGCSISTLMSGVLDPT